MKPFTLIKSILVFFFFARHIRVFATVASGNYFLGSLLSDFVIGSLVFFYATYSLVVEEYRGLTVDRVKAFLLAILTVSLLQATYFFTIFRGDMTLLVLRSLGSFRKVFLPLALLFLFSRLLKSEFTKHRELVFKKLFSLVTLLLYVAIAYHVAEFILRRSSPLFNSVYVDQYIAQTENLSLEDSRQAPDFMNNDVLGALLPGEAPRRVYGIGLSIYVSGALIFACYLYYVCFAQKFRVFSGVNLWVFVCFVLTGSRQFLFPFLVLNGIFFMREYKRYGFLAIGLMAFVSIPLLVRLLVVVTRTSFVGGETTTYFPLLLFMTNLALSDPEILVRLFLVGNGPIYMTLYGTRVLAEEAGFSPDWLEISNFGFLTLPAEIGVLAAMVFFVFHFYILRKGSIRDNGEPGKADHGKRLGWIIVADLVVFLAHDPILFDRTIIVFHVFFLSMLYSWYSTCGMRASAKAPEEGAVGLAPVAPFLSRRELAQ